MTLVNASTSYSLTFFFLYLLFAIWVYFLHSRVSWQWESTFSSTSSGEFPVSLLLAPVPCACELLGDSRVSNSHLTVGAVVFPTQATTSGFHIVGVGWQAVLLLRHLTNPRISHFYFVTNDQIPD